MFEVDKNNEALQPQQPEAQLGFVADATGVYGANADSGNITDIPSSAGDDKESWSQKYGLFVSFFVAVVVCCLIYLVAVIIKERSFEASQKRIVEIYERHTIKMDKKGQQPLVVFQQPLENHEKFEEEIKSLLELQQSYIQDNFGSFEIWAGVLTIVFLVFSFFSLQKSEQMEQQSRDALKKIKKNMEASDTKLLEFDNEKSTRFTVLDNEKTTKLNDFETKSTQKLDEFNTKLERALDTFSTSSKSKIEGLDKQMETAKATVLEEGRKMVEQERNKAVADLSTKIELLRTYYKEEFVKVLDAHQVMLKKDYDLYRMQLEDVVCNPKEATNKDIDEIFGDSEDEPINNQEES